MYVYVCMCSGDVVPRPQEHSQVVDVSQRPQSPGAIDSRLLPYTPYTNILAVCSTSHRLVIVHGRQHG